MQHLFHSKPRERERENKREKVRERESDRETERQIDRQRDKDRDRGRERMTGESEAGIADQQISTPRRGIIEKTKEN